MKFLSKEKHIIIVRRFNAINCLFFMIKMIERNRAYENDCVEAPKPTPVT